MLSVGSSSPEQYQKYIILALYQNFKSMYLLKFPIEITELQYISMLQNVFTTYYVIHWDPENLKEGKYKRRKIERKDFFFCKKV